MYAVTLFYADDLEDESVEAHPARWLSPGRTTCRWPPMNVSGATKKLVEPRDSWATYRVKKILTYTDDLQVARSKANKAVDTSDIETAASDVEKTKSRQRRKKNRSDMLDDGLIDESPMSTGNRFSKKMRLQVPHPAVSETITSRRCLQLPPSPPVSFPPPVKSPESLLSQRATPEVPGKLMSTNASPEPLTRRDKMFLQHLVEIKAQERMHTQALQTIAAQLQILQQQVRELGDGGCSSGASQIARLPADVHLPLKTIQHVDKLEVRLKSSPRDRQTLISYLGRIGGMSVKDATRRILNELMSNTLAMQFNFNGNGQKHGFKNLQLKNVVNDAVRCNRSTNSAANAEIEHTVREWLRTASDRDGGRRRREEKQRQRLGRCSASNDERDLDISECHSTDDDDDDEHAIC